MLSSSIGGSRMVYTQATILESLRVGSLVPMSVRTCTEEYDLGGLKVREVSKRFFRSVSTRFNSV